MNAERSASHTGPDAPVALVTGAARRLGAGIAQRLHADGWRLALHFNQSGAELEELLRRFNADRPDSAIGLQADLSQFDRLPELIARTVGQWGRMDGLVNNASTFFPTPFGTIVSSQCDALFSVNTCAPLYLSQAAAPHLRASGGAIVNLIDIHAQRPLRDYIVYGMSKAALAYQTRALAQELAPQIRVNGIAPGAILWPESGKDEAEKVALLAQVPLARIGTVEEIADAAAWLLDRASYTTGQIIAIDGGRLLDA